MVKKIRNLVVDTSAFIKNVQLQVRKDNANKNTMRYNTIHNFRSWLKMFTLQKESSMKLEIIIS
jgi:hypothetical protein